MNEGGYSPEMAAKIDEAEKELKKYADDKATVEKNLETFDTLVCTWYQDKGASYKIRVREIYLCNGYYDRNIY